MMHPTEIKHRQREAAAKASQDKLMPLIIWPEDVGEIETLRDIPNLGDHVPEGWQKVFDHFVDSSGFGADNEPALTMQQFADGLQPGFGYGITRVGQFQVYVGQFEKESSQ